MEKSTQPENKQNKAEIEKLKKELIKTLPELGQPCVLDEEKPCDHCGECLVCDLDPTKLCDNCGKCLDSYNTDEKGYVKIKIDKIIREEDAEPTLEELYHKYGLDGDDD